MGICEAKVFYCRLWCDEFFKILCSVSMDTLVRKQTEFVFNTAVNRNPVKYLEDGSVVLVPVISWKGFGFGVSCPQ